MKRDATPEFQACVTNIVLDGFVVDIRDRTRFHSEEKLSALSPTCADAGSIPQLIRQKSHIKVSDLIKYLESYQVFAFL